MLGRGFGRRTRRGRATETESDPDGGPDVRGETQGESKDSSVLLFVNQKPIMYSAALFEIIPFFVSSPDFENLPFDVFRVVKVEFASVDV